MLRAPKIAAVSVAAVMLFTVAAASVGAWSISRSFDEKVERIPHAFPAPEVRPPSVPAAVGGQQTAQNILLLGSDSRGSIGGSLSDIRGQRSDTMMVVHIAADRSAVSVMSILRDSWVEIPGHGEAKINAALSWGGVPLAVQTVERLLGVRLDHVAVVDLFGFKSVTDALGGVDLHNPIAFDSYHLNGYHFDEGPLHLNGAEALAFARERYAFADGDFERVRNQQLVTRAILGAMIRTETLTDVGKLADLFDALTQYIAVDDGLDAGYIAGLGVQLAGSVGSSARGVGAGAGPGGGVAFFTLPTEGTGSSDNGQSIVNVDWDELLEVRERFQTDTLSTYQAERQTMG
jgi:LCP family protein required for cell wall assembly